MKVPEIGKLYLLDNSFYQFPSMTVYRVKDRFDDKVVIESIAYFCRKDPYNGLSNFDVYTADLGFAVIQNAKPLEGEEHKVIQYLFSRLWDYYE